MAESNNSVSEIYVCAPSGADALTNGQRKQQLSTSPIAHQLQANKLLLMIENQILKYVYCLCVTAACQCEWLLLFTPYLGCILNAAARNAVPQLSTDTVLATKLLATGLWPGPRPS